MFPTLFKFTGVAYKKDLVFWYFFSKKFSSHVGCPPSGTKEGLNMAVTGVSHSCILIELGPICKSMAASLWFKSFQDQSLS